MAAIRRKHFNQRAFRRKLLTAGFIIFAALLMLLLTWRFLLDIPFGWSAPVHITEIMTVNTSVLPDEDNDYHAWIELHNTGTEPVNLRGYALSNSDSNPQKWVLPEVMLNPDAYLVVFASGKDRRDPEAPLHTSFKIDPEQSVITLIGSRGRLADRVEVTQVPENMSYGRDETVPTRWLFFTQPTPGRANQSHGFPDLAAAREAVTNRVTISEIMASNRHTLADEDGDYPDWLEIKNNRDKPIDLGGYMLSDDPDNLAKWVFPSLTLDPGQYLVVFASNKDRSDPNGPLHTNFRINKDRDTIILTGNDGYVCDRVEIRALPTDVSYGRDPQQPKRWLYFFRPTPGYRNDDLGLAVLDFERETATSPVIITEIMASNRTTLAAGDGSYPDWIELYNNSSQPVSLLGYMLSDDTDDPMKWLFPDVVLQSHSFLVLFASGDDQRQPPEELHTNFRINRTKDKLYFRSAQGKIIDRVLIEDHLPDVSFGRDPDDPESWYFYPSPTPGRANETHGFSRLDQEADVAYRQLQLHEIMSMNTTVLADDEGDYGNWIELHNTGSVVINLQGVGLSDDADEPLLWTFPDITLEPADYLLVFASGKNRSDPDNGILHTNFGVSVLGDQVILSDPIGRTIDTVQVPRLPENVSYGRSEHTGDWLFFTGPSPGAANSGSFREGASQPPLFSKPGGFYQDIVTVILTNPQEQGEIRYTLDGSIPNERSTRYTGPIELEQTTVVRANVFADHLLPLNDKVQTYFIDVQHTVPVLSIAIDPYDFDHPLHGIHSRGPNASSDFPYWGANFHQDWERPAHFEYYENSGKLGFRMHVGFKLFGAFSRAMNQKSFAIYARNRYEADEMTYPFLENKDLIHFKQLVFRTSGQDASMSKIRDIMMTNLLAESTNLDYQGYRQTVLYINGQYWGIYNIREKINRYFIHYNHGLEDLDAVDILEGNATSQRFFKAGDNEHYMAMLDFVSRNNMNDPENYAYIQSILDVENYADYQIAQMYYAHTDNGNIRFWRARSPDGKWRWIIYDLDWAFFNVEHNTVWHIINPQGTGYAQIFSTRLMRGLLESDEFRQMYIERFAYHMNNTFHPDLVIAEIDRLAAVIEPEMPLSVERWPSPSSITIWERQVERLRDFARRRPGIIIEYIQRHFRLSDEEMMIFDAFRDR